MPRSKVLKERFKTQAQISSIESQLDTERSKPEIKVQYGCVLELSLYPLCKRLPICNPMEKVLETSLNKPPIQSENCTSIDRTPAPHHVWLRNQRTQNSGNETHKLTPDRLQVPEAFKYQERYKSPTDFMMSPVSKGLLARSRKTGAHLPLVINPPKLHDPCFQDAGHPQI
ncbi:hypothetical protein NE237_008214 [Protea cynaroides]|uniref:Uncharacterized protein n=1 Tax=Protea cynaroides TaxID=273540 RepID=A0A9Q0QWV8_9MAGN|nr:hypothetical protein NE237_008214 [Protea cynaroides]